MVAERDLGNICDEGLAELGPVNREVSLAGDDCDRAGVSVLAEAVDGAESAGAAADNDDSGRVGGGAGVGVGGAGEGFDGRFGGGDVDGAVFAGEGVCVEGFKGGSVLYVAGGSVEAGYKSRGGSVYVSL